MSTCVEIRVCLHVFVSAPAVCLRLTCLPAPCVKCVWPKKPPCGCGLLCLLAAGVWHQAPSPCQHSPSANVLAMLLVRSPGREWKQQTPMEHNSAHTNHTQTHTGSQWTRSSHRLFSHFLLINMQRLLRAMELEKRHDKCLWLWTTLIGLMMVNNDDDIFEVTKKVHGSEGDDGDDAIYSSN